MTTGTRAADTSTTDGRWIEPEGIGVRGTLVLIPGRGENASVYARWGRRLASDAYRVVVVNPEGAAAEVAQPGVARPVVVVGSDTGATHAARLAADRPQEVDGLIVAGVALDAGGDDFLWDPRVRTACPTHQRVLADAGVSPAAAPDAVHLAIPSGDGIRVAVPSLAIHGEVDAISAVGEAVQRYREWEVGEIAIVAAGTHDILNDVSHRSVAATVVLFLERLRQGPEVHDIVVASVTEGER
jgi:pimeloyl-ACP methyl ester carboxylesterase